MLQTALFPARNLSALFFKSTPPRVESEGIAIDATRMKVDAPVRCNQGRLPSLLSSVATAASCPTAAHQALRGHGYIREQPSAQDRFHQRQISGVLVAAVTAVAAAAGVSPTTLFRERGGKSDVLEQGAELLAGLLDGLKRRSAK